MPDVESQPVNERQSYVDSKPVEFILNFTFDGVRLDGQVFEALDDEEEDFDNLCQKPNKQSLIKVSVALFGIS